VVVPRRTVAARAAAGPVVLRRTVAGLVVPLQTVAGRAVAGRAAALVVLWRAVVGSGAVCWPS
jgi:hypothetical protein